MGSQPDKKKRVRRLKRRAWLFVAAGFLTLLVFGAALLELAYADSLPPGVKLGGLKLGGMKLNEAAQLVRTTLSSAEANGTKLRYQDKDLILDYAVVDSAGIGLTTDAVTYDIEKAVADVHSYGTEGTPIVATIKRLRALLFGLTISPQVEIDDEALLRGLRNVLGVYENPAIEPAFSVSGTTILISDSSSGTAFNYESLLAKVESSIRNISATQISVVLENDTPKFNKKDAQTVLPTVEAIASTGVITLTAGDKVISLKPATYIPWLILTGSKSEPRVEVSTEDATTYLQELLPQVSTLAKNAKFSLVDGVVKQIQGSAKGRELDIEKSLTSLTKAIKNSTTSVALTMRDVTPEATADTVANLGVKELVAVGKTNFAGSPTNRRYNISVGANLLNGLLIKPGEEFSLIKAIGPVDATLGYKQELVIKGDRTIPEFGGGLCQVGTTLFRAVMNAGLPVLERQNHSYRVSYYEPPVGMDATIYEPKPDFRFKNDYGTYLLLQTRIEGNDLIFEFWGTKDTRAATQTTPRVYNVVAPPAPLTIETTDIPVGTTKCVERAHNGSDAEFTYSVTKDGKKTDTLFKSHYKPWRQVCLVGVKKTTSGSTPKNTNGNSNTNSTPLTNSNGNSNTNSD